MNSINELISNRAKQLYSEITGHRRAFHMYPELSFKEYKTSKYIQLVLNNLSIPFIFIGDTGIVALIGKGDKCVALRADMDALPIHEETGLEFDSKNDGVMHACGHDMHMAMLLGAARILKEMEDDLPGVVKLIFQPGEEKLPGGASMMIDGGVLDTPVPGAIFAQHVNPGEEVGKVSFASGYVMASTDELYFTIKGKGTHAAQPHLGVDPILAASHLVVQLQSFVSRFRNPLSPAVLSIASFQGGTTTNIIPDVVQLKGTLRSFDAAWRTKTLNDLVNYSRDFCHAFGAECQLDIVSGYPALFNDPEAVKTGSETAVELFGINALTDFEPKMWAEDFAYYAQKIPAAFWFLGVRPKNIDEMPALHNPGFAPDEEAMVYGTALLAGTAFKYLQKNIAV